MSAIFISYRRGDDAGEAGRLFDRLKERFGARVFMDVEGGIQPGEPFGEVIARRLLGCKAVIVVIGPRWSGATDGRGKRRLDDPEDWVRIEIATALRNGLDVFPVLVDGASMPTADELPDDLAPLAARQALELRNTSWDFDVGNLIRSLVAIVPGSRLRKWRVPGATAAGILAGFVALKLVNDDQPTPNSASLEVALYAVENDERGSVFAAKRFNAPDVSFPDSILERVVDWLADTLNVEPATPTDVAHVVLDVPADLRSRNFRLERTPPGPMEVNLWDVTGSGKIRLPIDEGSLRTRSERFVLEISLPGFGVTAVNVSPGVARLDTLAFRTSTGTVRIGIEDIAGHPGVSMSLTRVLATRAGFTAVSPAALETARRAISEARQRILEDPMTQMQIRESLGADYLLVASVRESAGATP